MSSILPPPSDDAPTIPPPTTLAEGEHELLQAVIENLDEPIAVIDRSGRIVWANRAWDVFDGEPIFPAPSVGVGRKYLATYKYATGDAARDARQAAIGVRRVLAGIEQVFLLDYACSRAGIEQWFQLRAKPLFIGRRRFATVSHLNVTEYKLAELQFRHAADHDRLTGLPNRRLLTIRLQHVLEEVQKQPGWQFALLFLDFDDFKHINDKFGHSAGDQLLVSVAKRLSRILPAYAMAARLGGDEFVVLCHPARGEDEATALAREVQAALKKPHHVAGQELEFTTSIGVLIGDHRSGSTRSLLRHADHAMYEAKKGGKNQIAYRQLT